MARNPLKPPRSLHVTPNSIPLKDPRHQRPALNLANGPIPAMRSSPEAGSPGTETVRQTGLTNRASTQTGVKLAQPTSHNGRNGTRQVHIHPGSHTLTTHASQPTIREQPQTRLGVRLLIARPRTILKPAPQSLKEVVQLV